MVELLELGPFYIVIWLEVLFELFIRCCNRNKSYAGSTESRVSQASQVEGDSSVMTHINTEIDTVRSPSSGML